MNILALDLGNTTGWAFVDSNGRRTSGVWKLHNPLCDGLRFLRLRTNIYAIHEEFGIHHIVYERVRRHEGTQAAHVYGGYLAIVHLFGQENNITVAGTEVKSLKVHATGMGADDAGVNSAATGFCGRPNQESKSATTRDTARGPTSVVARINLQPRQCGSRCRMSNATKRANAP